MATHNIYPVNTVDNSLQELRLFVFEQLKHQQEAALEEMFKLHLQVT